MVVDSLNIQQINLLNDLKKKLYGPIHYPTRSLGAPIKFQALGVECKSRHASWKTYIIQLITKLMSNYNGSEKHRFSRFYLQREEG